MVEHHLVVESGRLMLPLNDDTRGPDAPEDTDHWLLLCRYPEGDCDICPWPFTEDDHPERLYDTLFDEGNMGNVQPGAVYLPDGTLFGEIVPCGFNRA